MRASLSALLASAIVLGASPGCSGEPWRAAALEQRDVSPEPAPALSRVDAAPPLLAEAPPAPASPAAEPAPAAASGPAPLPGDAPADDASVAPEAPQQTDTAGTPLLVARHREVFVYERPSFTSKKLGYLRRGASVQRSPEPSGFEGCARGFYRIRPHGFVCRGAGAQIEGDAAGAELATVGPDRSTALPYVYARARNTTPPLYVKLPSAAEQRSEEPDFAPRRARGAGGFSDVESSPVPERLALGGLLPTPFGGGYPAETVTTGRAVRDSGVALLTVYDHAGRRFGLTTNATLVPLDRLERVVPSEFRGLSLDVASLPVVFVLRRAAWLYAGHPHTGLSPQRPLAYREAVPVSGERVHSGRVTYLRTTSGDWVRDEQLVHVEAGAAPTRAAKAGRRWIHVSIARQTLVAYEGERPVYVTLVSTGADGAGDPETTRSTVRGQFLIHTKHVSTSMTGDEVGDEYDLEVPYVQYFSNGYALHAAYWHDGFGTPRSHGCVNLSPIDARWLFHWTEPSVPQLWHGAFSLRDGTLVHITP